jgi:DNA-binding YbaB/EbfC family protein
MVKGLGDLMKQMQKVQARMEEAQKELEEKQVEGSAGGGMVKVIANGKQEILSVKIDKEVVNPDDIEMLEDLIVAAIANAKEKAKSLIEDEMGKIIPGGMGSLGIPGLG